MPKIEKKPNKQERLECFLKQRFVFRYNEIMNVVEITEKGKKDFRQLNENGLWRMVNRYHEPTSKDSLLNTVSSPEVAKPYNALKNWLENLGRPKIDQPIRKLTSYIILQDESEEERERLVNAFTKWFVGAIKTLYNELYVHKQMIVLEGKQGIGKTPFSLSLLPLEIAKYYTNDAPVLDLSNKDSKLSLTSEFIIFFEEINQFLKTKVNRDNIKSFMARKRVRERLPYARTSVYRQRIASFIGSCNESDFLNDPTGTKRFTVFGVKNFRNRKYGAQECIEDFMLEYIDSCWAFAFELYDSGFNPEYTIEEEEENELKNERYKFNSPEFETITEYLEPAEKDSPNSEFLNSTQICSYLNGKQHDVIFSNINLGKALIRCGYEKHTKRVGKMPIKGYYVRKIPLFSPVGWVHPKKD